METRILDVPWINKLQGHVVASAFQSSRLVEDIIIVPHFGEVLACSGHEGQQCNSRVGVGRIEKSFKWKKMIDIIYTVTGIHFTSSNLSKVHYI